MFTRDRRAMKAKRYTRLIDKVVYCRWEDISCYDVENVDKFIARKKFASYSTIFVTTGKLIAEDNGLILIAVPFAEKNPNNKRREATIESIPKGTILEIEELELKGWLMERFRKVLYGHLTPDKIDAIVSKIYDDKSRLE